MDVPCPSQYEQEIWIFEETEEVNICMKWHDITYHVTSTQRNETLCTMPKVIKGLPSQGVKVSLYPSIHESDNLVIQTQHPD